ncbi:hypothetical protein ASPZODRAFT_56673 [Penicilliopsis zonata CBS 506.65]|uniref:PHD-type domain-containing protein n=1 Tax=Penicilliopsis zonata CBS 506.65 TaxID=1073090 RepID=A0A1L9SVM9_9EURO|nr:hypothetical protein ASPZODRAFT_56673 [Penicilliopsis zonata CBS 506.65]OJJ51262.1 hypothetical protein ASPZODRAFT_56673 [Penicilliopsis zonata CBS 506.65]
MARSLRARTKPKAEDSRPTSPQTAPVSGTHTPPFPAETTRPSKRRRTGANSRVPSEPLPELASQDLGENTETSVATGSKRSLPPAPTGWVEPPRRPAQPSWKDTPWSALCTPSNPILSTMRPLGQMPAAADYRKVGLVPPSKARAVPGEQVSKALLGSNGDSASATRPPSPLLAAATAEESMALPSELPLPEAWLDDDLAALEALPLPISDEFDIDKLKSAVENAIRMAAELENRTVARGLLRLWSDSSSDPFLLSVLDGVIRQNPDPQEKSAFRALMRAASRSAQADLEPTTILAAPPMGRVRSATSSSSLSSAKSLDPEMFAPGIASASAKDTRSRAKGKLVAQKDKEKARASEPPARRSVFPPLDAAAQRKRAYADDPEYSEEALETKRRRMTKSFDDVVVRESAIRSSLSLEPSNPPSLASDDSPPSRDMSVAPNGTGRSASPDGTRTSRMSRPATHSDDEDSGVNSDACHECDQRGNLVCCDGCVDSYHFTCLKPPLNSKKPPEGKWYCPKCSVTGPMDKLLKNLERMEEQDFQLPGYIREYFAGATTGRDGKYMPIATNSKNKEKRSTRTGVYHDPNLLKMFDSKGKLIVCVRCGRTTNNTRPIIRCDYCPCYWHLDCVDPPLANPPVHKAGCNNPSWNWMCPNHASHEMYTVAPDEEAFERGLGDDETYARGRVFRHRRPRRPRIIDVDVLLDDSETEEMEEEEHGGVVYRLPEHGIKLDFITRVKRENMEAEIRNERAAQYKKHAEKKLDELVEKATAYYTTPHAADEMDQATRAILNSRTSAEREAIANLVEFSQQQPAVSLQPEEQQQEQQLPHSPDKIGLLIDHLRSSAPHLPPPETEIASLHALQALIARRLQALGAVSAAPADIPSSPLMIPTLTPTPIPTEVHEVESENR